MVQLDASVIEVHLFRKVDDRFEYLILQRASDEVYPNLWQPITGSVEKDEPAWQAALREIKEETGLNVKRLWIVPIINAYYSKKYNRITHIPVFAAEIDVNDKVVISSEHQNYKWVEFEEAKNSFSWQGQRNAITIVNDYFTSKDPVYYMDEIEL